MPNTHSDPSRTLIPIDPEHRFRSIPDTDSEPLRTVIPVYSGRGFQRRWSSDNFIDSLSPHHKPYEEGDYVDKEVDHAQDQRGFTFTT